MHEHLNNILRGFLGLVLVVGISACTPSTTLNNPQHENLVAFSPDKNGFAYGTAQATIREGLKNITKRYIDPISMDVLAVSGLKGLATIDPSLFVTYSATTHTLELGMGKSSLKTFLTPAEPNATAWAFLATKVIRTARAHSPDMDSSSSERVFEAVFDGMMSNLDIFSRYAGGEEAHAIRAQRDGFGGIGVSFTITDQGLSVTRVSPKSPANRAGLRIDDVIVEIEGISVLSKSARKLKEILHGPVGSMVAVSVERQPLNDQNPMRHIDYNLRRGHIIPTTVTANQSGNILTLTISSFNKSTTKSLHSALRAREASIGNGTVTGVVLDLRGNPGGLLSQSVNVADLFLKGGRIISTQGRHLDSVHEYTAGGVDLIQGLPLVVLVDGNSASAAEIVASALQDLGRAVVVGTSSYGKGTVQTVVRLPNDGEMTLTWSRLISPSGYALHGLGVMPVVCVTNSGALVGESMPDAILAPLHIQKQREAMNDWWAAGLAFNGQRAKLRDACPSKIFEASKSQDLLKQLAVRVISDPDLYQNSLIDPNQISTASRH